MHIWLYMQHLEIHSANRYCKAQTNSTDFDIYTQIADERVEGWLLE